LILNAIKSRIEFHFTRADNSLLFAHVFFTNILWWQHEPKNLFPIILFSQFIFPILFWLTHFAMILSHRNLNKRKKSKIGMTKKHCKIANRHRNGEKGNLWLKKPFSKQYVYVCMSVCWYIILLHIYTPPSHTYNNIHGKKSTISLRVPPLRFR
jgi:hypothetical protein